MNRLILTKHARERLEQRFPHDPKLLKGDYLDFVFRMKDLKRLRVGDRGSVRWKQHDIDLIIHRQAINEYVLITVKYGKRHPLKWLFDR